MAWPLRQSTASQEVSLGYFLDSTDGNTEETGLTIANTDIKLHKAGATTLANKNSGGGTHISNGVYYVVLDATDTDTIGGLTIYVHVSGALSVKKECVVYDEAVYDVLFGTTAPSTLTAANVNSEVDTALADIHLDHLIATAASIPAVTSGTFLDQIMDDGTATYDRTTDSLQAIRDRGNAAWEGEAGPTEADIWSYATRTVDLTSVTALLGTPADTDLATDIANLPTATDTATAVLGTTLTISAPSDGSAPTLAQALSLLMGALGVFKLTRSGTTLTAYANDETTVLATWTIDSASAPTSRTRAS